AFYGRYTCSSGNDDQFLFSIIFREKAVAVRPPHKKAFSFLVFKDFVGYFSYFTDGQIHIVRADAADRDGSLPVFRNRDFKELPWLNLSDIVHAEGVFNICVTDDFLYPGQKRHIWVIHGPSLQSLIIYSNIL